MWQFPGSQLSGIGRLQDMDREVPSWARWAVLNNVEA